MFFIFSLCSGRAERNVYRLIFLSTEIFSKRRKFYLWTEEKPTRRKGYLRL